MPSAVNVLTNTPKISNFNKGDIFQIISSQGDEKKWQKSCHPNFASVWDPLTCSLKKKVLKQHFLESALAKSLTGSNFGNTQATTTIFFLRKIKIWWRFNKRNTKLRRKFFPFYSNSVSIGNSKFSQSQTGYLSSVANVLTNTPKISNFHKRNIFQLILFQSDCKIWNKCSHAGFTSVWHPLTRWLSKEVLKRCFLESDLTKSLAVCNFGNTLAITIIFFSKMFEI